MYWKRSLMLQWASESNLIWRKFLEMSDRFLPISFLGRILFFFCEGQVSFLQVVRAHL